MVHCAYCACEVDVEVDDANGFSCCVQCGRVLEDTAFATDVTFQKDAAGESAVVGQFVSESGVARGIGRIHGGRVYAYQADSHEKAQARGRQDIAHLVDMLSVRPREESIESAHRLYKLALQRNFTRGRRTNQVAAACLYLVCRQDSKPFLLIDFSDALQINVFTLGAVFLQLAKLLRLTDHPMFAKPVDPSLYIHRFADRLDFGRQMHAVANTALRLVASMKRDWIQTGRRPSGICGAALYIAAHIHGFERSIRDVVSVVHIGEHTLSKRLYEFSSTSASMYTAEEFEERAKQIDQEETKRLEAAQPAAHPVGLLESAGCEHLRMGEAHFAHAMCKACYIDFIQTTGGVYNGANPPAYDRNRRKEVEEMLALPEPEEATEGADDEFDREEHDIAEDMVNAFHDTHLQQFAPFLPSSAEEAEAAGAAGAGGAEEEAAAGAGRAAQRRGRTGGKRKAAAAEGGAAGTAAGSGGGSGEVEGQRQQQQAVEQEEERLQQLAAGPGSKEAALQQEQQEEAEEQAAGQAVGKRHEGGEGPEPTPGPTAAAGAAAVGPSQLSDQTGAAAGAGAGMAPGAAAEAAVAAAAHSQRSDQTAAAAAAADDAAADANAGAIVPVGPPAGSDGAQREEDEDEEGDDTLSDIADSDIDMYLADEAEVRCKEEIWNMMNKDWLEKQAAKRAAQEAAERAAAEQAAAQEAADAAGVQYKRGRGRPTGSRSRSQRVMADLPPAETAQEAAMRMLDHRKLSNKINYSALADLFEGAGGGGGGTDEAPALAPEVIEGDDEDGRGAAVTAAMRERQQQQEAEQARRQAKQQAALEAERQAALGRRVGGLGLPVGVGGGKGKLGGGGPMSPRGVGSLRSGTPRAGGLGSLRDSNFRSQVLGGGGGTKKVRFSDA